MDLAEKLLIRSVNSLFGKNAMQVKEMTYREAWDYFSALDGQELILCEDSSGSGKCSERIDANYARFRLSMLCQYTNNYEIKEVTINLNPNKAKPLKKIHAKTMPNSKLMRILIPYLQRLEIEIPTR